MKPGLSLLVLGLVVMLGLSMEAFAQGQVTVAFPATPIAATNIPAGDGVVGTGIYAGTLNGVNTNFICDDDYDHIGFQSTWQANVWNQTNVTTPGNGIYAGIPSVGQRSDYPWLVTASGGLVGASVQQSYNMAAYLANLLLTQTYTDSGDVGAINWAIWNVMDDPVAQGINDPGGNGCTTGTTCGAYWVNNAWANGSNYYNPSIVFFSGDGNRILSGADAGSFPQELITETPEPLSMVLLGTFLTLAGAAWGKKKRSSSLAA